MDWVEGQLLGDSCKSEVLLRHGNLWQHKAQYLAFGGCPELCHIVISGDIFQPFQCCWQRKANHSLSRLADVHLSTLPAEHFQNAG